MTFAKAAQALLGAAAMAGMLATAAPAAIDLDFGADAEANGERAFADGTGRTIGGVGVKFYAGQNLTSGNDGFDLVSGTSAYLDSFSGGKPAGLGACSTVNTSNNQCRTASDDNTGRAGDVSSGYYEWTSFVLDKAFRVEKVLFRDRDHYALGNFTIDLFFGPSSGGQYKWDFTVGAGGITGADLLSAFGTNTLKAGDRFGFGRSDANGAKDFYVESVSLAPVPLPATLALGLLGLGGLGAYRQCQRKARAA